MSAQETQVPARSVRAPQPIRSGLFQRLLTLWGRSSGMRWTLASSLTLVVLGTQGFLVALALAHERREHQSRLYWQTREVTRLASWRMETVLAPLLAGEASRPSRHYDATHSPDAYDAEGRRLASGVVVVPSPLLGAELPLRRLHFTWSPSRGLGSPQVLGEWAAAAEAAVAPAEVYVRAAERLEELARAVAPERFAEALERLPAVPQSLLRLEQARLPAQPDAEYLVGMLAAIVALPTGDEGRTPPGFTPHLFPRSDGGEPVLALLRPGRAADGARLEGVWLDWPPLRKFLLAQAADLLTDRRAGLELARGAGLVDGGERLVQLPAVLRVGAPQNPTPRPNTGLGTTLLWSSAVVLAAMGAVLLALRAAWRMSERRARFASLVTHELRTPLTSFHLYLDLLAGGHVRDPEAAKEYLETLRSEAGRLGRVLENVLAHTRLERGLRPGGRESVDLAALFERNLPEWRRRAEEAGLSLMVETSTDMPAVLADPASVTQILGNLVDNAAKYAAGGTPARIEVSASPRAGQVDIAVRDHGPGVPIAARRRIFDLFERGPDAAPGQGLGLGLALCRELARESGGDLELESPEDGGARFVLRLPISSAR